MRFQLLGRVQAWAGDRPVSLGVRKQRFVLAVLALEVNRLVPVPRLVDLIWPDAPPASARRMIHTYVSGLRAILGRAGAVALDGESGGYELRCDPLRVDAHRFRDLVARARRADDDRSRVALLDEALALWRGPALAGVGGEDVRVRLGRHLDEARLAAVEDRADALLRLGRPDELADELAALAEQHPHRQRISGQLMLALHRTGRTPEALAVYERARRGLADELGIDPADELQRLHHGILRADPALAVPSAPAGTPAALPRPAQLPPDLASFTGRAAELGRLFAAHEAAVVIDGTAGVGKTALAVHAAHRLAPRFPDGQLYADLRGYDPGGSAAGPAEVVRGFLDSLGVPPERVPVGLQAQVGLYRSLLAGKRVLVVLDNAREAAQVRPLLPGAAGCLVLVTSRGQLAGLVAADGAHPLTLDLPDPAEARELLVRRIGAGRVAAEPAAVDRIVAGCARLPLALAVVAARAATRPGVRLEVLAAELRQARGGLDALADGDPASDVRTVFSWSYRTLSAPAARLFRLLGLCAGPDISTAAAASLAGLPMAQARRALAELARAHLVGERPGERFAQHDLLRAYAAELAVATDPDRRAAQRRLFDHYLHTARGADLLMHPHRDPIALAAPLPGATPEDLADQQSALAWFTAEHRALLAAVTRAGRTDDGGYAWRLAWTLENYLFRQGHWQDQAAAQRVALDAARRRGDRTGEAYAHRGLGRAYPRLGRVDDAHRHLQRALELFDALGDTGAQANTHRGIGWLYEQQGDHRRALRHNRLALHLCRAAGHRSGQASALNAIGWFSTLLGDPRAGLAHCRQALALQEQIGDHRGQADTWDSLGYAHHRLGEYRQAVACYENAVARYRDLGDRYNEADARAGLGRALLAAGDPAAARRCLTRALAILDELGHPDAGPLRAELAAVGTGDPVRPARAEV